MRYFSKETYDISFKESSQNMNSFYRTMKFSTNGYLKIDNESVLIDDYIAGRVINELLEFKNGEYLLIDIIKGNREEYFDTPKNLNASRLRKEECFQRKLYLNIIDNPALLKQLEGEEFIWFELSIDDKEGKATDLVSYNKNENRISLYELKYGNNKDTLLHTILEIQTYYQRTKFGEKFSNDFKKNYINAGKKIENTSLDIASVRKVIIVSDTTMTHIQYNSDRFLKVKELMEKFNIKYISFSD